MTQLRVIPNEQGNGFDVIDTEDGRVLSNHATFEDAEAAVTTWAEDLEEGSIVDLPGDPSKDDV